MSIRTTDSLDGGRVIFREPEAADKNSEKKLHMTDPVCGMDVNPNHSSTEQFVQDGATYYFCSGDCREKFERKPEEFVAAV